MRRLLAIAVLVLVTSAVDARTATQDPRSAVPAEDRANVTHADTLTAVPNDGRRGEGTWRGDTLTLTLRIVPARWQPEGSSGPTLTVWAFAASEAEASIPGPMLDVAAGTQIRVALVNTLDTTVAVHGLGNVPMGGEPRVLRPGAHDTVRFVATTIGTHYYWGSTPGVSAIERGVEDGQLNGALLVSPRGAPRPAAERVLMITESFRFDGPEVVSQLAINGLSWPHTERLKLPQGDSAFFRVLNTTGLPHPMHLHGFYYRVTRRGTAGSSADVPQADQALVVTDVLPPGDTHDMAFMPSEPGGWIYHCHISSHTSGVATFDPEMREYERTGAHPEHGRHMAGLVMGIDVTTRAAIADRGAPRRRLRLYVQAKDSGFVHGGRRYMYAWREGTQPAPPTDTVMRVAPTLVLARDERVAITIVNRLNEPTAVHWHGLEIESPADGVPHVSGHAGHPVPPVPPGDSMTVTFTPPRSGTFMYHAHFTEMRQISGGLYGTIVVDDQRRDSLSATDHVITIGGGGPNTEILGRESPHALVNGSRFPPPVQAVRGVPQRLRLASIHVDWPIRVTLAGRTGLVSWRRIAKDGAPLPASLSVLQAAWWEAGPGETLDAEVTFDVAGRYLLEVRTQFAGWYILQEVIVRNP